jgi:hypothetical protein
MSAYQIGQVFVVTTTFKNAAGAATDPTTIRLLIKTPDGTETTYLYDTDEEVARVTAGVYKFELYLTQSGNHYYRWVGTGTVIAATEGALTVQKSRFTEPLGQEIEEE